MESGGHEIERRKTAALAAIKRALGTPEDEYGATLFVSHHLAEINETYWQQHLGNERPQPDQVLQLLELRGHWGDSADDGIDTFDFTLPGGITDYVVSVRFAQDGQVSQISMEN